MEIVMILYTSTPKRKAKKSPKKVREQYQAWLKSHQASAKKVSSRSLAGSGYSLSIPSYRKTEQYASVSNGAGNAFKAPPKVYTGTSMKGIATMHKSNAVPVFTDEHAVEISSMRR
jgi:hypothetical protein